MTLPSYAMSQSGFPDLYERWLVGPLFRPFAESTLDEVAAVPGESVLDIACGTGIVSRVARERLGRAARIVGVDISPDMLAVARRVAPDIDWREGNAVSLPLGGREQFDVVVCHQGLQFFPDKPGAAGEMRRALSEGGRVAVATWCSDAEIPLFRELRDVAERHLGPVADHRYGYGDPRPIEALLLDAGFHDTRSKALSRTLRFEDGQVFLRLNAMALVGMSAAGKAGDEGARMDLVETILRDSTPVAERYADGSSLAFEVRASLVTAAG